MSIQYIFFDLDGTLLPLDQDNFIRTYMEALGAYMVPYGFDCRHFIKTIWHSTAAMLNHDGAKTNEEVFWQAFCSIYGPDARQCEPDLNTFYHKRFPDLQDSCGYNPKAASTIQKLKELGFELVLATQPVFPAIATESRIKWAGLNKNDFEFYTTYENSNFTKPNPAYYHQILDKLGAKASNCLMVGNDVTEDMIAKTLGMKVFLLTDCLINKNSLDLSEYPQGDLDALLDYIQSM